MRLADKSTVQVGLVKNPFGLQPFASNNFYESMAFYTGFEDKYDLGVTYASRPGPIEWQLGYFPARRRLLRRRRQYGRGLESLLLQYRA